MKDPRPKVHSRTAFNQRNIYQPCRDYWFQFQQGQADFGAYEVNAALTNMGDV